MASSKVDKLGLQVNFIFITYFHSLVYKMPEKSEEMPITIS